MRAQGGFELGLCHPLLLSNTEGPAVITQNLPAPAVTRLRTGSALAGSQCTRVGGCLSHHGQTLRLKRTSGGYRGPHTLHGLKRARRLSRPPFTSAASAFIRVVSGRRRHLRRPTLRGVTTR